MPVPTTSYEYITSFSKSARFHFDLIDKQKNYTQKDLGNIKKEISARPVGQRRDTYRWYLETLMGFNPKKFLENFASMNAKQQFDYLEDSSTARTELSALIYFTEYTDQMLNDMKITDAAAKNEKPLWSEAVDKDIRAQAVMYKPYLETLKYFADKKSYMTMEGTDHAPGQKISNEAISSNLLKASETVITMSEINNARKLEPGLSIEQLDQTLSSGKQSFMEKKLTELYGQLKATDPKSVLTNTSEFRKMRNGLNYIQKNYGTMKPQERDKAFKALLKYTQTYMSTRADNYNFHRKDMKPRSVQRFELAQKISALCEISIYDYKPIPQEAKQAMAGNTPVERQTQASKQVNVTRPVQTERPVSQPTLS